jgi:hypothetical protein
MLRIVLLVVVTRIVFYMVGVRYDANIGALIHVADSELLRTDLLRTLYYLHTQPPLFNAVLGLAMKASAGHWGLVLMMLWLVLGLCALLSLHMLMLRLGVARWVALGAVSLLAVSPATILYENWLFYDYPIMAMLCVAMMLLRLYLERRRIPHLAGFLLLISAIVLTRSLFHLAWMALIIGLLVLFLPGQRRTIVMMAVLPLVVASLPYLRNLVLFSEFSCSTWFGPSLAKMTVCRLDSAERWSAVAKGELSPASLVSPYSSIDAYPRSLVAESVRPPTGVPVLDALRKEHGRGTTNFNSLAWLGISRAYRRDAIKVLATHPVLYAGAVANASFDYCYPASVNFMMGTNRGAISGYEHLFDLVVYGQFFDYQSVGEHEQYDPHGVPKVFKIGLFILVGMLVALPFGVMLTRRMLSSEGDRANGITLLIIIVTILWVALVGNLLDIGENYRFRFMIDPFHYLLLALLLTHLRSRCSAITIFPTLKRIVS